MNIIRRCMKKEEVMIMKKFVMNYLSEGSKKRIWMMNDEEFDDLFHGLPLRKNIEIGNHKKQITITIEDFNG